MKKVIYLILVYLTFLIVFLYPFYKSTQKKRRQVHSLIKQESSLSAYFDFLGKPIIYKHNKSVPLSVRNKIEYENLVLGVKDDIYCFYVTDLVYVFVVYLIVDNNEIKGSFITNN